MKRNLIPKIVTHVIWDKAATAISDNVSGDVCDSIRVNIFYNVWDIVCNNALDNIREALREKS